MTFGKFQGMNNEFSALDNLFLSWPHLLFMFGGFCLLLAKSSFTLCRLPLRNIAGWAHHLNTTTNFGKHFIRNCVMNIDKYAMEIL